MKTLPEALLDGVLRVFDPWQVILFGSHARDQATLDSDIDLYVVVDDDTPAERLNWKEIGRAREGYRGAVDIIVARRSTFERKKAWVGSLASTVANEGLVIYARS